MSTSKIIRIDSMNSGDRHTCSANGDGVRIVVWWLGCDIRCPGCHNQEYWDFDNPAYEDFSEKHVEKVLCEMEHGYNIYSGLSILGGEPFSERNIDDVITLCSRFRERFPEKNIWIWSGHEMKWLESRTGDYGEKIRRLFSLCDFLVDGHFEMKKRNISLKFRGSENQHIIDLREGRQ